MTALSTSVARWVSGLDTSHFLAVTIILPVRCSPCPYKLDLHKRLIRQLMEIALAVDLRLLAAFVPSSASSAPDSSSGLETLLFGMLEEI